MGFIKEFKEFALKGNVIDLAVGVIIGGAFSKITNSLVTDIIMPPLGLLLLDKKFSNIKLTLKEAVKAADGKVVHEAITMNVGNFIQVVFDFTILAFAIFIMVKTINEIKRSFEQEKEEAIVEQVKAAEPSKQEILLTEIRDLLKSRPQN